MIDYEDIDKIEDLDIAKAILENMVHSQDEVIKMLNLLRTIIKSNTIPKGYSLTEFTQFILTKMINGEIAYLDFLLAKNVEIEIYSQSDQNKLEDLTYDDIVQRVLHNSSNDDLNKINSFKKVKG